MNKIMKLTLVLLLICAIVAGVLGVVNELTYRRIDELTQEKTKTAYSAVLKAETYNPLDKAALGLPAAIDKVNIDSVNEALDASGNVVGYVIVTTFSGAQGNITQATGVDSDFLCSGISIIEHSETSGLGAVAASTSQAGEDWRAQFPGQGEGIALSKAGGEIDAISGATITSRTITNAVAISIQVAKEVAA